MDWRWSWFWSILWNIVIHATSFNWDAVARDLDDLSGWWRSLWSEIENRIRGAKSWLIGYAYGLYVQAVNWINSQIDWAKGRLSWLQGYAFGLYLQATSFINSQISWLRGHAEWLVGQARSFASGLVSGVYAWARPYIDQAVSWVRLLYEWVQPYRDLISSWLVRARGAIDWLKDYALGRLQSFLSDPVGYVLGWLLTPVRNIVNWWQQYGPLLMNYVANELSEWLTIWTNGKRVFKALVDDPEQFIFDLLAPKFINWLTGVLADNW